MLTAQPQKQNQVVKKFIAERILIQKLPVGDSLTKVSTIAIKQIQECLSPKFQNEVMWLTESYYGSLTKSTLLYLFCAKLCPSNFRHMVPGAKLNCQISFCIRRYSLHSYPGSMPKFAFPAISAISARAISKVGT